MTDSFITELKRRNVFKVSIAYLVLSWVVIQVTQAAVPAFNMPEWVNTVVFFFGILGFPFAIFFAWAFEITPDGIKRESEITAEESITAHTGRKLDFVIIGLMAVALGYFIYESRFATGSNNSTKVEPSESEFVTENNTENNSTKKQTEQEPEGSSIAVLPFVNMSSDPEQEYFSDGISEEILNVLAQIPKLKVTSRSSAFFYKGTKINISEVAEKLGVSNVLEGSVRKSGNRIRITAQLIEAATDTHLWSETYDRELTDIFKIQDEISAAIVEALKSKLGLNSKAVARDMSAVNLDAHNEYLKGRFYVENRNQADLEKALALFEKAIELSPEYAPAWMGKAWATYFLNERSYGDIPIEVAQKRATIAIDNALLFDPKLPEAYGIKGQIETRGYSDSAKSIAIEYYKKAIKLNPNYADAYSWYANILFEQPSKRLEFREKAVKLSPMSMLANVNYAKEMLNYGKVKVATEIAEHMVSINPNHTFSYDLASSIHLYEGNYAKSIITMQTAIEKSPGRAELKFDAASHLGALGLQQYAAEVVNDIDSGIWSKLYLGNNELALSLTRELFPRYEEDSAGYFKRALMEGYAGNYIEAVKYFKLTSIGKLNNLRIYSYQQVGESELALELLDKRRSNLAPWLEVQAKYLGDEPIEGKIAIIAFLEGDIDKVISNLKLAMDKNYILDIGYKIDPMYEKLRQHPEWPSLLEESDKRAAVQREIYLKLIAEKEKITL